MHILIADDDAGIREALKDLLKDRHEILLCENGLEALELLEKTTVDVVITDNQMPKLTGLELIRRGREMSPGTAFLLMTAFGSVENALEAIRLGADDYFLKPFESSEIFHRLKRIEDLSSWRAEHQLKHDTGLGVSRLIGHSPTIRHAIDFIEQVASATSPVLILGPSGSGKEVMAKAIHESAHRAMRPFVAINCASLSEQLLESELFGHEKGAFTGANATKLGKFELAKGGTLFLDEVGELTPAIQARLLRVLQEQEFFRVGGVRQIKTDARVIAATHRPLKEMVKSGEFREDLYFRLNVLTFTLAPLCDRPEDIPLLIQMFWHKLTRESGHRHELAPQTMSRLLAYSYPGNIRELQNVLERLAVLGAKDTQVGPHLLPPEFLENSPKVSPSLAPVISIVPKPTTETLVTSLNLTVSVEALERRLISQAMERTGNNQVKAADLLQITRGTLQYKLKKYQLSSPPSEPLAAKKVAA